jgi:hypothetical protein
MNNKEMTVQYFLNDIYIKAAIEIIDIHAEKLVIAIIAYEANTISILVQQSKSVRVNEPQHCLGSYQ